jgi:hypothetical protein
MRNAKDGLHAEGEQELLSAEEQQTALCPRLPMHQEYTQPQQEEE